MLAAVMVTMSLASCSNNGGSSSDTSPSSDSQSSESTPEGDATTANPDGPIALSLIHIFSPFFRKAGKNAAYAGKKQSQMFR